MKWEYLFEHVSSRAALERGYGEMANRLGADGWELVTMTEDGQMVFRRPKKQIPVKVGPNETKEGPYV